MQGAKRQGMKSHIKVKKVQDNAGIGLVSRIHTAVGWPTTVAIKFSFPVMQCCLEHS